MSCFTYIHGVDDGLLNFSSIVRRRINERAGMLRFFEAPMQNNTGTVGVDRNFEVSSDEDEPKVAPHLQTTPPRQWNDFEPRQI
ncbi:hypothetical protein TNCV_4090961 [Trichonephila clavipes]|nr:hypothetical protein TNCV_4090961 [Trichonephila clavipes]